MKNQMTEEEEKRLKDEWYEEQERIFLGDDEDYLEEKQNEEIQDK